MEVDDVSLDTVLTSEYIPELHCRFTWQGNEVACQVFQFVFFEFLLADAASVELLNQSTVVIETEAG